MTTLEQQPRYATLIDLLEARSAETCGYSFRDDSGKIVARMSYADLARRARQVASALRQVAEPGERAILLYEPGLEYIVAFFGCVYAGLVAVPAYPPDPARIERTLPRLSAILKDARAGLVLSTGAITSMAVHLFERAPELGAARWVATDELPAEGQGAFRPPALGPASLAFLQYTSGSTGTPKGVMLSHRNLLHNLESISRCFGAHRGSTGVIWLPPYHDMGLIGGILEPLYHGFNVALMSPLTFLRHPLRWLQAISEEGATISGGPNFAFELCVRKSSPEDRRSLDLRSWEVAFCGAEPVRPETLDRFAAAFGPCGFRKAAFYPCYGLAEGTLIVSGGKAGDGPIMGASSAAALEQGRAEEAAAGEAGARLLVGCGRSLPDQELVVVHPEALTACPAGHVGEIWLRGPSVAQGYWGRAEETKGTFRARLATGEPGEFLRTGDLGFLKNGELFVTGRRKDLIILRGRNHYPQDIELTVEQSHPAIRSGCSAAFAVEVDGEERLALALEIDVRKERDLRARLSACEAAIGAIRERLAMEHDLQPHAVALLPPGSIPKTSSGKIQRHACRAAFLGGELQTELLWRADEVRSGARLDADAAAAPAIQPAPPRAAPRGDAATVEELRSWLCGYLARALGGPAGGLDPEAPITRYGLDSLRAVELSSSLEQELGAPVPLEVLLRGPSPDALARHVAAQRAAAARPAGGLTPALTAALTSHRAPGPLPLAPVQQRLWFLVQLDPDNPVYNIPVAVDLSGELDVAALQRALDAIARRHEPLRASIEERDGKPVQVIAAEGALPLAIVDLTGLPLSAREVEAQRRSREEARRPFQLARGPLARATLLRIEPRRHVLLVVAHHLVADGWSFGVLARELSALYGAFSRGLPPGLADLPLGYADYVLWKHERLDGGVAADQLTRWGARLAGAPELLELPTDRPRPAAQTYRGARLPVRFPRALREALEAICRQEGVTPYMALLAGFALLLGRCSGQEDVCVGSAVAGRPPELSGLFGMFTNTVVLRVDLSRARTFRELLSQVRDVAVEAYADQDVPFERVVEHLRPTRSQSFSPLFQAMLILLPDREVDLPALPGLEARPAEIDPGTSMVDLTLSLRSGEDGFEGYFEYSADLFDGASIARMASRLGALLLSAASSPDRRLSEATVMDEDELRLVTSGWNATRAAWTDACIHEQFSAQVRRTPDATACVFEGEEITYRELDARAGALAGELRSLGVGPEVIVGLCAERSIDMLVGLLGVLKAGGAYLPLDPSYPSDRIGYMLDDAGAPVVVTEEHLTTRLAGSKARAVMLGRGQGRPEAGAPPAAGARPGNAAYVIYTSGSTGKPKGVVVPHRSVANFFSAMDRALGPVAPVAPGARWLAVTSISFDISVLELLWTLTRGLTVVLQGEQRHRAPRRQAKGRPGARRPLGFSLFYFADDADQGGGDRYRLLWEGARFADRHGFMAVWTPERHFHAFGGLYPNPSVVGAAIAAMTERVAIRAGSVVLPLHHPVRIAEEWALLDNISRGRVGVSFASGWHARDFVLAPERYADRKRIMLEGIDAVRRLWRGERLTFPDGAGTPTEIQIRPQPVQRELPVWLTAAGNPETFEAAGRGGMNILTHLLGQSIDDLAERIAIYREARRRAGHEGEGHVTLMLHTFVERDADLVRARISAPFRSYLRSSADLMRGLGRSLGIDLDSAVREEDLDMLVSHAFERYVETSGLFGTPSDCLERVAQLKEIGVDEIGCLIDFGVEPDAVLASLPYLDELKRLSEREDRRSLEDTSAPRQIERYQVDYLQCTPSLLRGMMLEPSAPAALSSLRALLLGGEPLPFDLVEEIRKTFPGALLNMYGPTETTIWSSTHLVERAAGTGWASIGRPIDNTALYICDRHLQLVPVGVQGELYIGGEGVTRGYLSRPALTAERFLPDPFSGDAGARMYRTGDRVRWLPDGTVEFLGRTDHQVKLRGFRIELGEIEAMLAQHEAVALAVVSVREDTPGDRRLVAYVVPAPERSVDEAEIKRFVRDRLPDYMVPSVVVALSSLPLTANGKIDRKALPRPSGEHAMASSTFVAPRTEVEGRVAQIWAEALGVPGVGVEDDFFALGGHSLLATQVVARLRSAFGVDLPLGLIFQSPTVAAIARHIEASAGAAELLPLRRVERAGPLPLSLAQERMWFLHQLSPESVAQNVAWSVRFSSAIDPAALERSVTELSRRHEILRTSFPSVDGRPVQRIAPPAKVPVPVTDLRGLRPDARMDAARERHLRLALEPFDLDEGPLLRVELLRLRDAEDVLVVALHHIITDGWSLGVLAREITALYQAFSSGRPSPLPELPIQYADFAVSQRQWLSEESLAAQLSYWKQALAGVPAVLELPSDRPRPPVLSYRGGRHAIRVSTAMTEALKALSRREAVTLFMTLLAAFQVLLHRYSGQQDIVVGSPVAGRSRQELDGLIGFFLNTVALRVDLSGDPSFLDLLKRVHRTALEAYAHQDLPFDKLVEELNPARSRAHAPLFQVMFILQDPTGASRAEALETEEVFTGTAMFDLTLALTEADQQLGGHIEYNADLFDPPTIARMAAHLEQLLEGIVRDPTRPISSLPLLPADERRTLLDDWTRTEMPFPEEECFTTLFEAQVERTPGAIAAVGEGGASLSYRALDERADALARALVRHGAGPDEVIALLADRGLDFLGGMLGVWKAGSAYLPLDPFHPPHRIAQVLESSGARRVLVSGPLEAALRRALEGMAAAPQVIHLEEALTPGAEIARAPLPHARPSNLAYVIYTSGSTGAPKGAMVEHRGMLNHLFAKVQDLELTAEDCVAETASQCFDISVWQFLVALLLGGRVHILGEEVVRDPARLLAAIEEHGISIVELVPSMLRAVLAEARSMARAPQLAGLRWMVATGEALPPELCAQWIDAYPGIPLLNAYGPTECSDDVTHHRVREVPTAAHVPIGRSVANMRLYLLDRRGQPAPIGVPGELFVGGVGVGRGYLRDPRRTADVFLPDPFSPLPGARMYKTGDLARYLPSGELQFLGRLDHQVKVRGFRIELAEIESALKRHPGVAEAVVVAREDRPGDKQLVAYVVPAAGAPSSAALLKEHARELLPEYMVPAFVMLLDALPLNANGKVDRKALPPPDRSGAAESFVAPRDALERDLAAIWAAVLGAERVGVRDDFFDLGGHSLLAVRLMAEIQARIGQRLPLAALFQGGTVERLAALLRDERRLDPSSPLVTITPGAERRPFFCVHPVGGNVLCYRELARQLGAEQPFYGLQSPGLDGAQAPPASVEEMAALYVSAVRSVQPSGPYLLGGWSMGGVVAFEMARQLERSEQRVEVLALIDAQVEGIRPGAPPADTDHLLHALFDHDLARVAGGSPPPEEALPALRRVFVSNMKALHRYDPGPYGGAITVFQAIDGRASSPDAVDAWRRLAPSGVEVERVRGDHYSILQAPGVEPVARKLRALIERARREAP
ncbi:amino acid adenylation domain-containing protein [Sorangium sp. So ce128]|uniref:amino acid adenylation domain-containing protein n=1 Tax=Sorangium sp. So ce128 TaxID=3133281 RepID=UPI003F5DDE94